MASDGHRNWAASTPSRVMLRQSKIWSVGRIGRLGRVGRVNTILLLVPFLEPPAAAAAAAAALACARRRRRDWRAEGQRARDEVEVVEMVEADRVGTMIRSPGRVFLTTISSETKVDARTLLGWRGEEV